MSAEVVVARSPAGASDTLISRIALAGDLCRRTDLDAIVRTALAAAKERA